MRKYLIGFVAGAVLSITATLAIPAMAEDGSNGPVRLTTIEQRVGRLEAKAKYLKSNGTFPANKVQIGTGPCNSNDPAIWHGYAALGGYYLGC